MIGNFTLVHVVADAAARWRSAEYICLRGGGLWPLADIVVGHMADDPFIHDLALALDDIDYFLVVCEMALERRECRLTVSMKILRRSSGRRPTA
jgi:hypothetical protein